MTKLSKVPAGTSLTCTIPAGQSLSNSVDCTTGTFICIITPPAWDYSAGLSFQVSNDNTTFYDFFVNGSELTTLPLTRNVCNAVPSELNWVPYLKLRSGSRDRPVTQTADRVFTIILAK